MCPMRLADSLPDRKWFHMDQGLFNRIRGQVFPLAKTVGLSCGAEPFSNPDIGSHLRALCESGVPGRELVTNGTLLDDEKLALLVKHPPTTLFVSIDGARPETHGLIRGGADLGAIAKNLRKLSTLRGRRRFPMIAFSTTLQKDNLREMAEIVDLAAEVGACAVGVVPLVPYLGLSTLERVVHMESPDVKEELRRALERATRHGVSLTVSCGEQRREESVCPYINSTVYLAADGAVYPCPYWNTGNPVGNMLTEDFRDIWNRREKALTPDTCGDCPEITARSREVPKDS